MRSANVRFATLCLTALLAACATAKDVAATTPGGVPGLVQEQPKDGPFVKTEKGFMVPYTETIPGTDITFEMIPIPGGEFTMGSPEGEADREDDEGPQFKVKVDPFWMGKHEVTWAEYKRYMAMYDPGKKLQGQGKLTVTDDNKADAVTIPTPLYDSSMTYQRGDAPDEPAVTMSPLAARQYTKWLSLQLGDFYRLPSESEWEYACRAGTTTAYSFGDNPSDLDKYGWYFENSLKEAIDLEAYHPVGSKKPNPWGLYDMHGNVSELVLDEYRDDHYEQFEGKTVGWEETIAWPSKRYPRVHRGGSWDSDADRVRSAARGQTGEDMEWKIQDPNTPKSPWWYTEEEARAVGMRIIRPLNPPDKAQRNKFWEEDVKEVVGDVDTRKQQGRALLLPIDPQLPAAIESVE